jgi:hypothetical protein
MLLVSVVVAAGSASPLPISWLPASALPISWLPASALPISWLPASAGRISTDRSVDTPALKTVLGRVERYVVAYESDLSTLVARERYLQSAKAFSGDSDEARTLISDFLFLRLPGADGPWLGFRDVLEVDGLRVARREERLHEIVASPENAATRAFTMSRESARYNIGTLQRTINVPVCVLGWMHPRLRGQFEFKAAGDEEIAGVQTLRIAFNERKRPTIVRSPEFKDIVSFGHIWVDPTDGRVLQTEQQNRTGSLSVTIRVQFQMNQDFGILVPSRMTELYEDVQRRLETEALYSDYRRFGVTARIK